MRIGVIFPQFEYGVDPGAIRAYAQVAEDLGYTHIGADDHVIGPNPERPGGWTGWVTYQTPFHEPLALFCFFAGLTSRIEFETCVLLIPQRQTVLAAKQIAEVDILSGGRLRLGIGVGWNEIEYIALGEDFHRRGRRLDEQLDLLRRLWERPLVDFRGEWHAIPDAGINPRPFHRIPFWFGGQSQAAITRAARTGDGWMPLYADAEEAKPGLALLERSLVEAGRSRAEFGLEARLPYGKGDPGEWRRLVEGWQAAGATHLSLLTTNCGFSGPAEHLRAVEQFAQAILS